MISSISDVFFIFCVLLFKTDALMFNCYDSSVVKENLNEIVYNEALNVGPGCSTITNCQLLKF